MQSASDTPSSHSRRVGAQPKRGLWPLLVAERRPGAGRTGAQQVVALRESRRRGIDPPGITSADATLLTWGWGLQAAVKRRSGDGGNAHGSAQLVIWCFRMPRS